MRGRVDRRSFLEERVCLFAIFWWLTMLSDEMREKVVKVDIDFFFFVIEIYFTSVSFFG